MTDLAFVKLAASFPREVVLFVLRSEIAAGRMVEEAGEYSIVPGAFDWETLLALAALGPVEPDPQPSARARDLGAARDDPTTTFNPVASGGAAAGRRAQDAA
jgi:hypothetical protein